MPSHRAVGLLCGPRSFPQAWRPKIALSLLRAVPIAVVALDTDGRVTALNPAAERLFGATAQKSVGTPYPTLLGASLADRLVGLFLRATRSRQPGEAHMVEATLPSGQEVILRASVGPIRDETNQWVGLIFAAEDMTAETEMGRQLAEEVEESRRLGDALQRYVGRRVAEALEAEPTFLRLGGTRQAISVLCADIRSYTTLVEYLPPEDAAALLLQYHGLAVNVLEREGATVERFIGDAVLALWNAPEAQPNHARLALCGALALQCAMAASGTDVGCGIGVNTGDAVVGNMGTEAYMHYSAVGDSVNVAARLQAMAGPGEVLCSASTLQAAGPGVQAVSLGGLQVKGRTTPVEAYRVEALEA